MNAYNAPGMYLADPDIAGRELIAARDVGTKTVMDLTTFDHGRDPAALRRVSEKPGVNIVMGTGSDLLK